MLINKQNKVSSSNNIKENYQYKVSIIVPCYNTKPWLDECLQSLVDQTLQDIEIICINDGSTDGTGDRLDKWQTQYPDKIKVIHQANNGVSNARNSGMAIAQGECIGFVDSDDFVDICMYEKLYQVLVDNSADVVKCDVITFNDTEKYPKANNKKLSSKKINNISNITNNLIPIYANIYRKKFFHRYKIQFADNILYTEDFAFAYELAMYCPRLYLLNNKLYYYRKQRKNQMTSYNGKNMYGIIKVFEYLQNKLCNCNLDNVKLIRKIIIKKQLSLFFLFSLGIKYKYKKDFLFRASNYIFNNNNILTIYKSILSSRYANPINYFIAPAVVILLHCCYLLQKLPFVKLKNFDDLD